MAEKDSTLVLKVDLGCHRGCKKIKKALCKFDATLTTIEIREKKYDEKNNTVTITGPFCPHKLKKQLLCKAGCVIICIECPPQPGKPTTEKPPEKKEEPPLTIKIGVCCIHCSKGHGGGPCHPPQCCQGLKGPPPCSCDYRSPRCEDPKKTLPCSERPPCEDLKKPPPPCYFDYGGPPSYCGCGGIMGYGNTGKFYIQEDQPPCVIM